MIFSKLGVKGEFKIVGVGYRGVLSFLYVRFIVFSVILVFLVLRNVCFFIKWLFEKLFGWSCLFLWGNFGMGYYLILDFDFLF